MINTRFYRGFIELNLDKSPKKRRMNRKLNDQLENIGGIFKPEYMMIDIDTYEDSDLFMQLVDKYKWKCHIVASDHGIHAIFRKPEISLSSVVNRETMSGIRCDIKQGKKDFSNSDYEAIKKNGKEREIIQYEDDPQVLPWQLMPFTNELDLKSIGEGDGRHGIHKQLISRASAYCSNASEILDFVRWVNDNIFETPRESVNWKERDVQDWLDDLKGEENMNLDELLQRYDIKDLRKIKQFIRANYDLL